MAEKSPKIFIISLDGATWDVLRPLIHQGYMPNLAQLAQQGIACELESVVPPVTAPAWTSFMTGKTPGKHGIFDFTRFDERTYSWKINNSDNIRSKTLWQLLSQKNRRVVVLNLPYTYPPYEVNGAMVSGWDAPSSDTTFTYPSSLRNTVLDMFPDYATNLWLSELRPHHSEHQFHEFVTKLLKGFEQGATLASYLLDTEESDVFMVHFQQTDWIQHKLWNEIEEACKNPASHAKRVQIVRHCYQRFDHLIGALLGKVAASEPLVILLSDHGFGPHMGTINPNHYLQEWGYYHLQETEPSRFAHVKAYFRHTTMPLLPRLYAVLARTRHYLSEAIIQRQQYNSWADSTTSVVANRGRLVDWSKTKVATIWGYKVGYLFVNLNSRNCQGPVQPGEEYENLMNELAARFRDLRHPRTAERLFTRVARGSEMYPQARKDILLPDLVLIPDDRYEVSFSTSENMLRASREGAHRRHGVLLITGKGVRAQSKDFFPRLIDLAPTILHLLGLPIPTDMEGRVLEEILPPVGPIRYEQAADPGPPEAGRCTEEDAALIEKRLRELGYVE